MNALDPLALISRLIEILEIPAAQLSFEAQFFLDQIEEIHLDGRPLVAIDATGKRLEQLFIAKAAHRTNGRLDLAVFCYSWALVRLARGYQLAAMNWAEWSAEPIDLSEFGIAALVVPGRNCLRPR